VGLLAQPATAHPGSNPFPIDRLHIRGAEGLAGERDHNPPTGQAGLRSGVTQNGIYYHNGPVITGTKDAYVVWYGDWSGATAPTSSPGAQSIITGLLSHIGGTPYFNINTTYVNGSQVKVSNAVTLAGQVSDPYSQGRALTDAGVGAVVNLAISSGRLPADPNGVYLVLSSGDVSETSGFLSAYCGWHTAESYAGTVIKYGFIGDPAARPAACSAQSVGPNGTGAGDADAMVSVIAHELEETATDPNLNAWYDLRGQENADKCAWTYGNTTLAPNGSAYNVIINGVRYLIQRNWVNAGGGSCAMSH